MGEVLGLRWRHVNLEHGSVAVSHALQRQKSASGLVLTDTRPIVHGAPSGCQNRLWLCSGLTACGRSKKGRSRGHDGPIAATFSPQVSEMYWNAGLFRVFKAVLKKAGLPDIQFHDLRHSAASLMLAQGVPLRVVMEVLGHGSST